MSGSTVALSVRVTCALKAACCAVDRSSMLCPLQHTYHGIGVDTFRSHNVSPIRL